jgi:membrane-associated HD superfamily phosphohydrolase
MKKLGLVGLVVAVVGLFGGVAPVAQASDASIRQVVIDNAQRQVKEDKRFLKAMQKLKTRAQLRKAKSAAGRQAASVQRWHDQLYAEAPETEPVSAAKEKMLDALMLYNKGIRRLQKGINQALANGGGSGVKKAKQALKNMRTASKRIGQSAEIIIG